MNSLLKTAIESKLRKPPPGLKQEVFIIGEQTEESFITSHLRMLTTCGIGRYSSLRKNQNGRYHYKCERGNAATGSSSGLATETRANSCCSYVSFTFIKEPTYRACIVRLQPKHLGHNLMDPNESCVNKICPELTECIRLWTMQGLQISEIIVKCSEWARQRGYYIMTDRQYFPTPTDIKYLRDKTLNETRFDKNDSVSLDKLIKSDLQANVIHYQPLSKKNSQTLEIVYMSQFQVEQYQKFGNRMIFVDATYRGITAYGYAFYAVVVRSDIGHGVPVAYIIISKEDKDVLERCFSKIKSKVNEIYPRVIMVDKDQTEISALSSVFPQSDILLCWFHVLQAVHRWITKRAGGGLAGTSNAEHRNLVIQAMLKMKNCSTEEDFRQTSGKCLDEIDKAIGHNLVSKYLLDEWISVAHMWCHFGRKMFHEGQDTNNIAERFFHSMKYQFLKGIANRRLDDLLHLLSAKVETYYSYLEGLKLAGRLPSTSNTQCEAANRMIQNGLGHGRDFDSCGILMVPSETVNGHVYKVDLVRYTCECFKFLKGELCKHLMFAKLISGEGDTNIYKLRENVAKKIIADQAFTLEIDQFTVYDDDVVNVVDTHLARCSCIASSYGERCLCVIAWSTFSLNTNVATAQPEKNENMQVQMSHTSERLQESFTTRDIIEELFAWSHSKDFEDSPQLHQTLLKAHRQVFSSFTEKHTARVIKPLHPYRKDIEKKKTLIEHDYSMSTSQSKTKNLHTLHDGDRDFNVKSKKLRIAPQKKSLNTQSAYGTKVTVQKRAKPQ
ncbi:uncharacterized protein [Ptychodera flava]|uniref:uncharacterized protein n=1 Tax=Ptychodera flava TaxID=63121 RepID=UPI003969D262